MSRYRTELAPPPREKTAARDLDSSHGTHGSFHDVPKEPFAKRVM